MLDHAPPRLRLWIRRLAAAAIAAGAIAVAAVMFLGSGWFNPWRMGLALAIGGLGLILLILAPSPSPRRPAESAPTPLLFAGIFATFGTLGPLLLLVIEGQPSPPQSGLVAIAVSGSIACGWAAAFAFRRWWLIPLVILFQIFVPAALFNTLHAWGWLANFADLTPAARRGALGFEAVASLALGYVLIVRHIRRTEAAQAHARAELAVAKTLHETLVPPVRLHAAGAHILGRSAPSAEMGGDLIDVIPAADRLDVVLADVSGHGVGAGIVMGMLKSAARAIARHDPTLPTLLAELNAVLTDLLRPGMFATAAVVRLTPGAPIEYALAGHLPILHYHARDRRVTDLTNDALPLAVDADERFRAGRLDAAPGDTLLLFTDGLIEVQNPQGRQLGLEAFRDAFARLAPGPLERTADALIALARAHGSQNDDQSLVLIRVAS